MMMEIQITMMLVQLLAKMQDAVMAMFKQELRHAMLERKMVCLVLLLMAKHAIIAAQIALC